MERTKIKRSDEKNIVAMRQKGHTIRSIAETFGLSTTKVNKVLAQSGRGLVRRAPNNAWRDKQIIAMRRRGCTLEEIASVFGLSCATVHYISTVWGGVPVQPRTTPEMNNRIVAMFDRGKSLREISAEVGLHFSTIGGIVRRHQGREN